MSRPSTLADDLFILAFKLPYWVSLTLAIVSFIVLHSMAGPNIAAEDMMPGRMGSAVINGLVGTMALFGQIVVPFIFILGAILSFIVNRGKNLKLRNQLKERPFSSEKQSSEPPWWHK